MQGIPRTDYAYCIGYPGLAMHRKPRTGYAGDAQGWLIGYAGDTQGRLCRRYPGRAVQGILNVDYAGDTQG